MSENNKFPLISGNLSLDLVNTEIVSRGQRQDLLLSERDVLELFIYACFNWCCENRFTGIVN